MRNRRCYARYFNASCLVPSFRCFSDELLGIDIAKKLEKIEALCEEAGKYSSRGYYEKAHELLDAGLREYPENCDIMYHLMYVSKWQHDNDNEKTSCRDIVIRLGEAILEISINDSLRQGAIQILCFTYKQMGRTEEAIKLAHSMPCLAVSSEMLLSSIYIGDNGYLAKQTKAYDLLQFLSVSLIYMQEKLDSGKFAYTDKELAAFREKQIALLHLFFENGDFGFYHTHLCQTHAEQAVFYVRSGEDEKAISHLRCAAQHAIGFVKAQVREAYTSLAFRGLKRGCWTGSSTDNDASWLIKQLDDGVFDALRFSSDF
ncbi:MAG: tetratricopeptide repeat protein [Eubacteriales bacterium]